MHVIVKNIGDETLRIVGTKLYDDISVRQLGHEIMIDRLLGPGQGADLDGLPENTEITVRKFVEVESAGDPVSPETKDRDHGTAQGALVAGQVSGSGAEAIQKHIDTGADKGDPAGNPDGDQNNSPNAPESGTVSGGPADVGAPESGNTLSDPQAAGTQDAATD